MHAPTLFDDPADAPSEPVPTAPASRPATTPPPAVTPFANTGETVLAVDGNSLTHRAWWGYAERRDTDPVTAGLYGLLALMAGVADIVKADRVVIGFDCRQRSVRKEEFAPYKSGRSEKPEGLDRLLDAAPEFLAASDGLAAHVVIHPGWEADDVCGSTAKAAADAGMNCVVATSDKDAFGLVTPTTRVLRMKSGLNAAELLDAGGIKRTTGVTPAQYTDYAALRGDKSDNLEGVSGIGKKTAVALLDAFPSIEQAVVDPIRCRSVIGRKRADDLIADWESPDSLTRRNQRLMTIRDDIPIDLAAARPTADPYTVEQALRDAGLGKLISRLLLVFAQPQPTLLDQAPPLTDADAPWR
jgi:DNA polymerase-1